MLQFSAIPCCHALLPRKTREVYETLFRVIRDTIVERHGAIGQLHTVLMDFEAAAHAAVRQELHIQTRGCTFHFGQCLMRRVQQEGFIIDYRNDQLPVKTWIRLIKAMALLSVDLVPIVWHNWLRHPPAVDDGLLRQKLQRFSEYVQVIQNCIA